MLDFKEEEGIDYKELVNQVGNEADLKALGWANAGLNTASSSIDYNNIDNMGGINIRNIYKKKQVQRDYSIWQLREKKQPN